MLMDITVIVRPEEDASFRRQLVETIVVWMSRCGCSRYPVDDGGGRISSERSPGRCPVSSPATWTLLPWDRTSTTCTNRFSRQWRVTIQVLLFKLLENNVMLSD